MAATTVGAWSLFLSPCRRLPARDLLAGDLRRITAALIVGDVAGEAGLEVAALRLLPRHRDDGPAARYLDAFGVAGEREFQQAPAVLDRVERHSRGFFAGGFLADTLIGGIGD